MLIILFLPERKNQTEAIGGIFSHFGAVKSKVVSHLVQKNEVFIYTKIQLYHPDIQKKNLRKIERFLGKERTLSNLIAPHKSLAESVMCMIILKQLIC